MLVGIFDNVPHQSVSEQDLYGTANPVGYQTNVMVFYPITVPCQRNLFFVVASWNEAI